MDVRSELHLKSFPPVCIRPSCRVNVATDRGRGATTAGPPPPPPTNGCGPSHERCVDRRRRGRLGSTLPTQTDSGDRRAVDPGAAADGGASPSHTSRDARRCRRRSSTVRRRPRGTGRAATAAKTITTTSTAGRPLALPHELLPGNSRVRGPNLEDRGRPRPPIAARITTGGGSGSTSSRTEGPPAAITPPAGNRPTTLAATGVLPTALTAITARAPRSKEGRGRSPARRSG